MITQGEYVVRRSSAAKQLLRRTGLSFIQLGAVFDVVRAEFVDALDGDAMTAEQFVAESNARELAPTIIVTDTESLAEPSSRATIGQVRARAVNLVEQGIKVCLISRAPRCSFPVVPGSSVLDDAAFHCLRLIDADEGCGDPSAGQAMPFVAFESGEFPTVFCDALRELGVSLLAALDRVMFDSDLGMNAFSYLDPREQEALRGAGLAAFSNDGALRFVAPHRYGEFREALAQALSEVVEPPDHFGPIADGLWFIERIIRRELRRDAVSRHGTGWRKQLLHGDLGARAVGRATSEPGAAVRSLAELRDPLEWLALGELFEVLRQADVDGLGIESTIWQKMEQELSPVRNRLSHMRLMKRSDREAVDMWVSQCRKISRRLAQQAGSRG